MSLHSPRPALRGVRHSLSFVFFLNDPATTVIYPLSLHDALPISATGLPTPSVAQKTAPSRSSVRSPATKDGSTRDRKSTRLNSSHTVISYAVFCLKKKNLQRIKTRMSCDDFRSEPRNARIRRRTH